MSDTKPETSNGDDVAVMSRVLDAEAAAADRIDAARLQATAMARSAQADARQILERADRRIQKLHRSSADRVARKKVEASIAFDEGQASGPQQIPDDIVREAVRRLSLKLIGQGDA